MINPVGQRTVRTRQRANPGLEPNLTMSRKLKLTAAVAVVVSLLCLAVVAPAVSAQTSPTPNADPPAPSPLQPVTGLRTTYSEAFKIVLTWDLVPGADGYVIDEDSRDFLRTSDNNWYTERFLLPVTDYTFRVAPYILVNGERRVGEFSEPLTATTPMAELRQRSLRPDGQYHRQLSNDAVNLEVAGYRSVILEYQWLRDGEIVTGETSSRFYDSDVVQAETYAYQVREVRTDGELGPLSDPVSFTIPGTSPGVPLPAPEVRQPFVDQSRAVFFLGQGPGSSGLPSNDNGAQSHEVWRDGELVVADINGWWTDRDLEPASTYEYQVRAIAVDGTDNVFKK